MKKELTTEQNEDMKANKKFIEWVKAHKKEILLICGVSAALITLVIYKIISEKKIDLLTKENDDLVKEIKDLAEENEKLSAYMESFKEMIKSNRTGEMLSAHEIGDKLGGKSAQTINKKLVELGFQIKRPYGDGGYDLTELGKLVGKEAVRTTPWDRICYINEWDSSTIRPIRESFVS